MDQTVGLAVLRHALTFIGGLLAQKGYIESGSVEGAAGAIMTVVGLIWSIWEKKNRPAG